MIKKNALKKSSGMLSANLLGFIKSLGKEVGIKTGHWNINKIEKKINMKVAWYDVAEKKKCYV